MLTDLTPTGDEDDDEAEMVRGSSIQVSFESEAVRINVNLSDDDTSSSWGWDGAREAEEEELGFINPGDLQKWNSMSRRLSTFQTMPSAENEVAEEGEMVRGRSAPSD